MRRLTAVLALMFAFGVSAWAADVRLAWDAAPDESWTEVRIYEVVGSNYVLRGTVAGSVTTFTMVDVQPGKHVYVARSYSDVWKLESGDSNQAITPNLNRPPANLVWSVVVN